MIGANSFTDGLNPLILGFLVVAIGMSFGPTTGYAINPARDLGPRLAYFYYQYQIKVGQTGVTLGFQLSDQSLVVS